MDGSIVIKAEDRYSDAIKKMSDVTKSFSKDQDVMEGKLKQLTENQRTLQGQLKTSGDRLKELHKQFDGTGDAIGEMMIQAEQAKFDGLKRNLSLVAKGAREAEKRMQQTGEAFQRNSTLGERSLGGLAATVKAFGDAGLIQMGGQFLQQAANVGVGSALGSDAGTLFSGALSGAASGAALGSIIPGLGTAVGAAIGAGIGTLSGVTQVFEKKDDAFKSYVQDQTETILAQRKADIQAGSGIAATREGDLRALTSILGSAAAAEKHQKAMIEVGRTPPFSYDTAMTLSRDMLGLGLSEEQTEGRIGSLANAAAALNLSESQATNIVSTLESAQLTGKLESRVTKSLTKMGINVYEALADTFDMSTDEVAAKLSSLDVDKAVQGIYDYMGERFAGAADGLTDTYAGAKGILESYEDDMKAAYGEGVDRSYGSTLRL